MRHVFFSSVEEGIEKIRKENYAYFLESSSNEYIGDFDLIQIGRLHYLKSIFLF
jgi:hypothetical protein